VLAGIGLGLQHVTMVRIYLTHFQDDYAAMNAVYRGFFPPDRLPARTVAYCHTHGFDRCKGRQDRYGPD
jgi:enamine deaminase RidA (YjgF/YER057c/UK114 family)